ncbi:MAG: acylneuraminate cytidylyltransferase family protein [Pseudomonadota bacterium]|nr:acylneuraminate cytidylyltransferase family protein [Pseudomonadota bacterium]
MTVLAITPARGGSKGIPRKNIKLMAGKPLLQYSAEAARKCPTVTHYVINTEDEEIRAVAESLGLEVQGRPEEFWHDNTFQEVDRLLQWSVADLESRGMKIDVVVLLYATAPLRPARAITECIDLILNQGYDSALTLSEDRSYIWRRLDNDSTVEPINYDPKKRGPNQKEGWNQWVENKAVYAMKRDLLMQSGCRLGGRIGYVAMSKLESIDIDTPDDFTLAEQVLLMRQNQV